MGEKVIPFIKIKDLEGKDTEISKDVINYTTTESVGSYAGTFIITLDNTNGKNTKICEPKYEVEMWVRRKDEKFRKIMAGYVDKIELERIEESESTIKIYGQSYASYLLDTKVSGKIKFKEGIGQALRILLKDTPFKLEITDVCGEGLIILNNISLIDIIRQLADEIGFTFRLDKEKVFYFGPFKPPRDSGIILTDKDIKSIKVIKE